MKKLIAPFCLMLFLGSVQYAHADRASCLAAAASQLQTCLHNAGSDAALGGVLGCAAGGLAGAPAGGIGALPGCVVGAITGAGFTGIVAAYDCGSAYVTAVNACPNE